jgi:hypothetical protein
LPTTRSKRKWLRLTSSVMHIGFPLELPMAECELSARGCLCCQEGPVIDACQCLLARVLKVLHIAASLFPYCPAANKSKSCMLSQAMCCKRRYVQQLSL